MSAALRRQRHPPKGFHSSRFHGTRQQPKNNFDIGYMPNWTKEHFTMSLALSLIRGTRRRVYKFVEYNNNEVKGSWYPEEI